MRVGAVCINKLREKKYFYNIDFLRLIFTVLIVYYHILHANIMSYTDSAEVYNSLADLNQGASCLTICFFVISGFFLGREVLKRDESFTQFAVRKIGRLWPVLAVYCLIILIFFDHNFYTAIMNSLFLQGIGLTQHYMGIIWFISPLFWTLLFYFALSKCIKKKRNLNLLIAVISYFSFVIILTYNNFRMSRDTAYGAFCLMELEALGCMGAGWLVAAALDKFYSFEYIKNFKYKKYQSALMFVVSTAAELFSFYAIGTYCLYYKKAYDNVFIIVVSICILLVSFTAKRGLFSFIFDNKVFAFCGKYTYSIFAMQQISFYIMARTLWSNTSYVVSHPYITIILSLLVSVILGIATYYIIEKPAAKLISSFSKKLFKKSK